MGQGRIAFLAAFPTPVGPLIFITSIPQDCFVLTKRHPLPKHAADEGFLRS